MGKAKKLLESLKCCSQETEVADTTQQDEPLKITISEQDGVQKVNIFLNKEMPSAMMEGIKEKLRLEFIKEGIEVKNLVIYPDMVQVAFKDKGLKEALTGAAKTILKVAEKNITEEDIKKGEDA